MATFPIKAKVVIVGLGGIVGASVAHHLVERGWDDIVGIDKSGMPTDIGSTAHASDFCYATSHDFLSCWTTPYSIEFYDKLGHYARVGGIEVARVGDDDRMEEIKRKVASGKAFGTRARLMEPAEIKEKFPLIEESVVQGGLWDPGCGPCHPALANRRGHAHRQGRDSRQARGLRQHPGHLAGHRERPHQGRRDAARHDHGGPCGGLRGALGPHWSPTWRARTCRSCRSTIPSPSSVPINEFAGTGKEIGWPLLRDQGNSAYMRDTGDPDHLRRRHDRVGLLRGAQPAPLPPARASRQGGGAAVALAARPRHGADPDAAGARDRADADPR